MSSSSLMVVLLVLIGFTSISSVAGVKCYWCYTTDTGNAECGKTVGVEQECSACYRDIYREGDKKGTAGTVFERGCSEDMTEGCKDFTATEDRKVRRCICKTPMCNGEGEIHGESGGGVAGQNGNNGAVAGQNGTGTGAAGQNGSGRVAGHHTLLLIAVSVLTTGLIFLQ